MQKTAKPASQKPGLLGEICSEDAGKKCLVLDLDETLVHSSFKVSLLLLELRVSQAQHLSS